MNRAQHSRSLAIGAPLVGVIIPAVLILFVVSTAWAGQNPAGSRPLVGTVKDALGRPIAAGVIDMQDHAGRIVAHTKTDARGQFRLSEDHNGTYALMARKKGFRPATMIVSLPLRAQKSLDLVLASDEPLTMQVSANRIRVQNTLTQTGASKYTLTSHDIKNLPQGEATPLNEVLLQMPGVALDQNQEIHVRGEHLGIQYEMNGVLLPLDLNTDPTFTQLLNSQFAKSVSLADGILPARYGYRTAGVVEIKTKDGCDGGDNWFQIYGGQRDTVRPSFQLQGCSDKFSYYATGLYLQSNLGFSSAVAAPDPIHDAIREGQGFTYLTYQLDSAGETQPDVGRNLRRFAIPQRPRDAGAMAARRSEPRLLSLNANQFPAGSAGLFRGSGARWRLGRKPRLPARVFDPLQQPEFPSRRDRRAALRGCVFARVQLRLLQFDPGRRHLPPQQRAYVRRRLLFRRVWNRGGRSFAGVPG